MNMVQSQKRNQICFLPAYAVMAIVSLTLLLSCDKREVMGPEEPQLPPLTDPIPYELLGSGTIVFHRIGPFPGEYEGCYVIDVDNRKTRGFDFGLAVGCCVSPDGNKIAFTKYSGYESAYDVYVINTDGSKLTRLDNLEGQDRFPSWSPDGNRLFFWVDVYPVTLYVVKNMRSTPSAPEPVRSFYNHPSGRFTISPAGKIAYVSNQYMVGDTATGLFVMDADGNNLELIVSKPDDRFFESPVFSGDGQKIRYLSVNMDSAFAYRGLEIMEVDVDGSNLHLLAELPATGEKEWALNGKFAGVTLTRSPDDTRLLLNLPEGDFTSHLYLINTDGSELTQITTAEGVTDREVSWGG